LLEESIKSQFDFVIKGSWIHTSGPVDIVTEDLHVNVIDVRHTLS